MTWKELKDRAEKLEVKDNDEVLISQGSQYAVHVRPDTLREAPDYVKGHPGQRFWILKEFPCAREYINPCQDTGR
jgi:hypothetical protein